MKINKCEGCGKRMKKLFGKHYHRRNAYGDLILLACYDCNAIKFIEKNKKPELIRSPYAEIGKRLLGIGP